jgi:thiol-disulfide isomerase/thioredoxin
MRNKTIFYWILGVILIVLAVWFLFAQASKPGKLDNFAKCLGEKGVTFYGAFWCPHCQSQKAMFGRSQKFLPYVECSTSDGKGQTTECQEKLIKSYPTWEFADGERKNGEVSLSDLAEKTACELPK